MKTLCRPLSRTRDKKIIAGKLTERDCQKLGLKDKHLWYAYEANGDVYRLRNVDGSQVFAGTPWATLTDEQRNILSYDYYYMDVPQLDVNITRVNECYQSEGDKLHALWTACRDAQKSNCENENKDDFAKWIYEAINIWLITCAPAYYKRSFRRINNERLSDFARHMLSCKSRPENTLIIDEFEKWLNNGELY